MATCRVVNNILTIDEASIQLAIKIEDLCLATECWLCRGSISLKKSKSWTLDINCDLIRVREFVDFECSTCGFSVVLVTAKDMYPADFLLFTFTLPNNILTYALCSRYARQRYVH